MKYKGKTVAVFALIFTLLACLGIGFSARVNAESKYTISYYSDTELLKTQEYAAAEKIEQFVPQKQGYIFMGWYCEKEFIDPFELSEMPAENVQVFAFWREETYTIRYQLDGGFFENEEDVSYSFTADKSYVLPVPQKSGYTFGGWYLNAELTGEALTQISNRYESVTLYAAWELGSANYCVEYYKETLSGGYTRAEYLQMQGITGETVQAPSKSYEGFVKAEGSINVESGVILGDGSLVLKLYFVRQTYLIEFVSDSGKVDALSAKYEQRVSFPTLEREGYIFNGWFYDSQHTSQAVIDRMPLGGAKLYAGWEAIEYDFVCIGRNGNRLQQEKIACDSELNLDAIALGGYRFLGYFEDEAFRVPLSFTRMPARDLTVYAALQPIEYHVAFLMNGGTLDDEQPEMFYTVEDERTLPVPYKKGFYFGGWFDASGDCKGQAVKKIAQGTTGHLQLQAWWESFCVQADSGYEILQAVPDAEGRLYLENLDNKDEYVFAGWFRDKDCTLPFKQGDSVSAETKLYAGWSIKGDSSKIEYINFRASDLLWLWIVLGLLATGACAVGTFFALRYLKRKKTICDENDIAASSAEIEKEKDEEKK